MDRGSVDLSIASVVERSRLAVLIIEYGTDLNSVELLVLQAVNHDASQLALNESDETRGEGAPL